MINQDDINFFTGNILWFPPNDMILNINQFYDIIFPQRDFDIIGVYGRGGFGLVLHVRHKITNRDYALKLLHHNGEDTDREFRLQSIFANYNMAPKLHHYEVIVKNKYPLIINGGERVFDIVFAMALMDPITMTVDKYIFRGGDLKRLYYPFECLIIKKYLLNYPNSLLHGDMHIANIAILKDGKTLGFIDFGWTFDKPSILQVLDCIPLISFLVNDPSKRGIPLAKFLVKLYNKMFKINLVLNNFTTLKCGGYTYHDQDTNSFLHSYNWELNRFVNDPFMKVVKGHVTIEDLKKVFPKIEPPKVKY